MEDARSITAVVLLMHHVFLPFALCFICICCIFFPYYISLSSCCTVLVDILAQLKQLELHFLHPVNIMCIFISIHFRAFADFLCACCCNSNGCHHWLVNPNKFDGRGYLLLISLGEIVSESWCLFNSIHFLI